MRKVRNYTLKGRVGNHTYVKEYFSSVSEDSPRVNGKLMLRANAYNRELRQNVQYLVGGGIWEQYPTVLTTNSAYFGASSPEAHSAEVSAYNQAYARFRGKLYKGNASLGVTLGSYRQSADMIRDRARKLANVSEEYHRLFNRSLAIRRGDTQSIASAHLEVIFGWQPLVQDIWAAANTVIQGADMTLEPVSGRGRAYYEARRQNWPWEPQDIAFESGTVKVSLSTLVRIENPNLWLAERAGILNPAAVAWDLVPWSFLVNMVTNIGSLVNSVTDFVGLSFDNESTTTTWYISGSQRKENAYPRDHPGYGWASATYRQEIKGRTLGSFPRPSFEFKIPEVNWSTAAMLASLAVQKVRKLDRLLSV